MDKKYTLTVNQDDKGLLSINSENDGFNAFELLGVFILKQDDVLRQLRGEVKPDVITRTVVKE